MTSVELLKRAIEDQLAQGSEKSFAIFDFDNTCIVNDIGEATFNYLCGHELLRDRTLLGEKIDTPDYHERVFHIYHALVANGRLKAAYMLCAKMFSGFTPAEAEAIALATITEEGVRMGSKMLYGLHIERGIGVRRDVFALIEYLRAKDVRIWIVSASAEPAVRAAMRHFGIEAELIGVLSVVKGGIFTSELESPMPIIEGKVGCVRTFVDPERAPLLGAGDSKNDLPMLETAILKVVVDRDNELSKVAHERGWFVI